jgi:hypothetical protein
VECGVWSAECGVRIADCDLKDLRSASQACARHVSRHRKLQHLLCLHGYSLLCCCTHPTPGALFSLPGTTSTPATRFFSWMPSTQGTRLFSCTQLAMALSFKAAMTGFTCEMAQRTAPVIAVSRAAAACCTQPPH